MLLIYATRSVLPSNTANAIQSAHMACALARAHAGDYKVLYRSPSDAPSPAESFAAFGLNEPNAREACCNPVPAASAAIDWLPHDLARSGLFFTKQSPDAVVYTRSLRLATIATAARLRTFIELHDPLTATRARVLRLLVRTQRLKGVVTTTPRLHADVAAQFPELREHLLVAGNAAPAAAALQPVSTVVEAGFNVGYAGSAFRGKGVEIVLACARLRPTMHFHVIGPTLSACRELGDLAANVRLVPRLPPHRVIGLLKGMDALLLPNQPSVVIRSGADIGAHTSPLKLFEYMAAGRPIVASNLPVFEGVLRPEENALLAPAADASAFCRHLDRLRDDPGLGERLGSRAQTDFLAQHTWDIRARRILDFIHVNLR